ncbi:PREDICTED: RNA-binding protein 42-like [Priapulus caudatus]|uniref:RNA-binding protein 42 n=1 Tax=Priapulus caudatus TaxID=37621 RepID=A0ABM1E7Q6_PRICU|nr:PREDICTED: RNA-binding protein 42-like [Priapulus caudatus]
MAGRREQHSDMNPDLLAEMDRFEKEISSPSDIPLPPGVILSSPRPPPERASGKNNDQANRPIIRASTFDLVAEELKTRNTQKLLSSPPPPPPSMGGVVTPSLQGSFQSIPSNTQVGHVQSPQSSAMFVPHQLHHRTQQPPRLPGPFMHGPARPFEGSSGSSAMVPGSSGMPSGHVGPRGSLPGYGSNGPPMRHMGQRPAIRPPGTYNIPSKMGSSADGPMPNFGQERLFAPLQGGVIDKPPMRPKPSQVVYSAKPTLYKDTNKRHKKDDKPIIEKIMEADQALVEQPLLETQAAAATQPAGPTSVSASGALTPTPVTLSAAGDAIISDDLERRLKETEMAFIHKQKQQKTKKEKKIVRMAGGQVWEDNSLLEWDPDDFRIFCGDLGNEVNDEILARAFSKYPTFQKAKVVRDKRTQKTKGYGFVSFKDPQDFSRAMREMDGKYVGSRPIKLRKSAWKDRNIDIVKKKQKEKKRLGLR